MDTELTKLRVGQAKPAGARTTNLPSVSVFRTPGRDHGPGCVGCELRGLLRSIAGWTNLYELSAGNLGDEEVGRLVEALHRNIWEVRRILDSASLSGLNNAVGADYPTGRIDGRMGWNYRKQSTEGLPPSMPPTANPNRWLVETVNPIIFVGSSLTADSKPGHFAQLRDLANRAMDRLPTTECSLLPEVPTHVSA